MKNNVSSLILNEHHPFWMEIEKYKERLFHYRSEESFNSFTQKLDEIINELNDSMMSLYFKEKTLFDQIYRQNLTFVDDQIKKEENILTREIFSRKIGLILKNYRPKIENVLPEIVLNFANPEFIGSNGLKALQKAMLYEYYFVKPKPEIKEWMNYNANRILILSLLFDCEPKRLANSFSKYRGREAETITQKTIQTLKEKKIYFIG